MKKNIKILSQNDYSKWPIPLFMYLLLMGEYEFMKGLQYGRKVGGTTKMDVLLLGSYTRFSCSLT